MGPQMTANQPKVHKLYMHPEGAKEAPALSRLQTAGSPGVFLSSSPVRASKVAQWHVHGLGCTSTSVTAPAR